MGFDLYTEIPKMVILWLENHENGGQLIYMVIFEKCFKCDPNALRLFKIFKMCDKLLFWKIWGFNKNFKQY